MFTIQNIVGVPTFGKLFIDSTDPNTMFGDDGTTVKYGETKSQLV